MHICLTVLQIVGCIFNYFCSELPEKAQNKFLLQNKAKNVVSLQVLKAIISFLLKKNSKMLISGQQVILKMLFSLKKQSHVHVDFTRMHEDRDVKTGSCWQQKLRCWFHLNTPTTSCWFQVTGPPQRPFLWLLHLCSSHHCLSFQKVSNHVSCKHFISTMILQ